jgi:hypothetical protein
MLTGCQTLGEIFEHGHWGLKAFLLMTAKLVAKEHADHSPKTATLVRYRSLPSHSAASAERLRTPNLA